jgi:hypothetical protein
MYSNSKEQVSLEEAYRMVHLVTEEKEECECGGECHCGDTEWCKKCDKPKDECECEDKEVHESMLATAIDAGAKLITDPSASQLKADMIGWVGSLASGAIGGTLLFNQEKAVQFVNDALMVANFNKFVKQIEEDLKGDDVQNLKEAHNLKVKLLKLMGYKLVAWAVRKGILRDPDQEHDFINTLVDKSEQKASELREM